MWCFSCTMSESWWCTHESSAQVNTFVCFVFSNRNDSLSPSKLNLCVLSLWKLILLGIAHASLVPFWLLKNNSKKKQIWCPTLWDDRGSTLSSLCCITFIKRNALLLMLSSFFYRKCWSLKSHLLRLSTVKVPAKVQINKKYLCSLTTSGKLEELSVEERNLALTGRWRDAELISPRGQESTDHRTRSLR